MSVLSAMFVGYSNGIGPVIGYHFGAQDHRELKNLRKRSLMIIGLSSVSMFVLSEILAHPFSAMFLQETEKLLPYAVHAFRIVSVAFLFTGMAIFGSAFFTALNNGQVSALISFMRGSDPVTDIVWDRWHMVFGCFCRADVSCRRRNIYGCPSKKVSILMDN